MRLQRQVSRKYKNRIYTKHCVVLPARALRRLHWEQRATVNLSVTPKGLRLSEGAQRALQHQRTRSYKGKQYTKACLVIPNEYIEQLQWKSVEQLEWSIAGDSLQLVQRGDGDA